MSSVLVLDKKPMKVKKNYLSRHLIKSYLASCYMYITIHLSYKSLTHVHIFVSLKHIFSLNMFLHKLINSYKFKLLVIQKRKYYIYPQGNQKLNKNKSYTYLNLRKWGNGVKQSILHWLCAKDIKTSWNVTFKSLRPIFPIMF